MTNKILNKNIVLVLNRNWQAIDTATPVQAFGRMAADAATALDIQGTEYMLPVRWEDWIELPVRDEDFFVRTAHTAVRVPTVMVLSNFARVPMRRPKFSAKAIRDRDGHRCQYTGRELQPGEGSIDHVLPRSRGGRTSWTNCVLAAREVNHRKADRTPKEAGLRLARPPRTPDTLPATLLLRNTHGIEDWEPFLGATKRSGGRHPGV